MPALSNLRADGRPSQLPGRPSSLPPTDHLQDPDSAGCCPSVPAEPQSCLQSLRHTARRPPPEPRLYQLNMHGGRFLASREPECSAAEDGSLAASSGGLQVALRLSPSASSAALPSPFRTFSSLLRAPPVQHPRSLTQ